MRQLTSRGVGYLLCVLMLIAATFSVVEAQQIQYGVYIGDQSLVNPDPNFNLYSAGANSKNVFEGNVGIGTANPHPEYRGLTVGDGSGGSPILGIVINTGGGPTARGQLFFQHAGISKAYIGTSNGSQLMGGGGDGDFAINAVPNQKILLGIGGGPAMTINSSYNVGIGTTNPTSRLHVVGDITATGVKNFQIAHPVEPERKLLIHSALEGPEAAVYYRGEAQLKDGKAEIVLPAYFEALARKEQRTVQLTPIDGWSPLYVVEGVQDGQFAVRTAKEGNPAQRFYWEVKAVRADIPTLVVEKLKAAD